MARGEAGGAGHGGRVGAGVLRGAAREPLPPALHLPQTQQGQEGGAHGGGTGLFFYFCFKNKNKIILF